MGLMVHSLEGMPEEHHRDYFIYLLDYGWKEPLSEVMMNNFSKMATLASEQKNSVVIMKADVGVHFSDEVLSWHSTVSMEMTQKRTIYFQLSWLQIDTPQNSESRTFKQTVQLNLTLK